MPATFNVELHFPLPPNLTPDAVIRTLHAYEPLIRPNPYLQSFRRLPVDLDEIVTDPFFTEDGSNIVKYEIHDRIPVVPAVGWTSPVVFPAIFQSIPAGVRLRADAAAGTRVRSIYGVERAQAQAGAVGDGLSSAGGGWELVERSHVECNPLLKPFVQRQFEAGHRDLGRKVLENMVAATQKSLPPLPSAEVETRT